MQTINNLHKMSLLFNLSSLVLNEAVFSSSLYTELSGTVVFMKRWSELFQFNVVDRSIGTN